MATERTCDFCENQKWFDHDLMYGCGKAYNVRVYLSTYVDVTVEANSYDEAVEAVERNSDMWFSAGNQILEHIALQDGMTEASLTD